MRLLIDTHLLLRAMQGSRALSTHARALLHGADAVYVSSVSIWEIAIKVALGKLSVDIAKLQGSLVDAGFRELPIRWHHAAKVRDLPMLHRDPFDRMLIAQAMVEPLHLLTHDSRLAAYSELVTVM